MMKKNLKSSSVLQVLPHSKSLAPFSLVFAFGLSSILSACGSNEVAENEEAQLNIRPIIFALDNKSDPLCPGDCTGAAPTAPFDFVAKSKSAGVGSTIEIPVDEGSSQTVQAPTSEFIGGMQGFENWSAKECGVSTNNDSVSNVLVAKPCPAQKATLDRFSLFVNSLHNAGGTPPPGKDVMDSFVDAQSSPQAVAGRAAALYFRPDGVALNNKDCKNYEIKQDSLKVAGVYALITSCRSISAAKPASGQFQIGLPAGAQAAGKVSTEVGGIVFGKKFQVLRTSGDFKGNYKGGPSTANAGVYFFGFDLDSDSKSGSVVKASRVFDNFPKINESATASFPIGPLTIDVTAKFLGTFTVGYESRTTDVWANGRVQPTVDLTVFYEGALNAWIAKAGVDGQIKLLKNTVDAYTFSGIAALPIPNNPQGLTFYTSHQLSASDSLAGTLSGNVNVFAKIRVPKFFGFKWKKYSVQIFSWPGLTANGYVFNERKDLLPIAQLQNN